MYFETARPLAIDLFCGLGGWTEGLLDEGYDVIGIDIERHQYGDMEYPSRLIVRDVLEIHGARFRKARLIVASPPCQEYSYMAMPWTLAKQKAAAIRADKSGGELKRLNCLFDACFRIQREASRAAGRRIPLIIENVRGAQSWVGPAKYNYGSFYLWGDVPDGMPKVAKVAGFRFDGSGRSFQTASVEATGRKSQGMNWSDRSKRGQDFTRLAGKHATEGLKGAGPKWDSATKSGAHGMARWTNPAEGTKVGNDWFGVGNDRSPMRQHHSKSSKRKMASAMIAKIPLPLSRHIAAAFKPRDARCRG